MPRATSRRAVGRRVEARCTAQQVADTLHSQSDRTRPVSHRSTRLVGTAGIKLNAAHSNCTSRLAHRPIVAFLESSKLFLASVKLVQATPRGAELLTSSSNCLVFKTHACHDLTRPCLCSPESADRHLAPAIITPSDPGMLRH